MASTYPLKIRNYDASRVVSLPPASAAVIVPGDLVTIESNALNLLDSADDDQYLCGVSLGISASGSTTDIDVCYGWVKGTAQMLSGTYRFGANVMYYNTSDDGTLTAASGEDIGYVIDDSSVARTEADIVVDAFNLSKYWDINA